MNKFLKILQLYSIYHIKRMNRLAVIIDMLQYSAEDDHEEFKFLEYQLEAFYKLCHVSNAYYLSI